MRPLIAALALSLLIPTQVLAGGHHPQLTLACDPSPCTVGGNLIVSGINFKPSSGGQQVFLWIGYPNDYCGPNSGDPCHGFYNDPVVADDGTFSVAFTNALLQSGTGEVAAFQQANSRQWLEVDRQPYVVP